MNCCSNGKIPPPTTIIIKIPEACAVYLPKPSTARLKIPPHIMDVHKPQSTKNRALTGTEAISNPFSTLYPGIETVISFGVKIAINIKQIAVAETTINCVRVATLPLMTLLAERPTNMSGTVGKQARTFFRWVGKIEI